MLSSELELKPQGKVAVTIVKANNLKNMEMIGKSDPYAVVHIKPLFKVKTNVVDNNLNPVWNQTFELIAEDKETQSLIFEVYIFLLFFPAQWVPILNSEYGATLSNMHLIYIYKYLRICIYISSGQIL